MRGFRLSDAVLVAAVIVTVVIYFGCDYLFDDGRLFWASLSRP
jgi:hypothetical protein